MLQLYLGYGDFMEKYIPDMYYKNIFDINYDKLLSNGVKCLLFDLDNTVSPYKNEEENKSVKKLFNDLREMGFKVIIFSNSPKSRTELFGKYYGVDYYYSCRKPFEHKFNYILKKYKYSITDVAIIGDQFLTDILGGNSVGITTILVDALDSFEPIITRITRHIENRIIKKLNASGLFFKGRYYE